MTAKLEQTLRGPEAFPLARLALARLEAQGVWPTPLNFELWLHYVGDPQGDLARAIDGLLAGGEPITDQASERLAAEHLQRLKLDEAVRGAGDVLKQQMDSVSSAIEVAQQSSAAYERTLDESARQLDRPDDPPALRPLIEHLSVATRQAQRETSGLERQLSDSTQEVRRLRERLEQVRRDAMTDSLTNLPNRKAFDEGLARACDTAVVDGRGLCLAIVDIDHFKRFNDQWGHQTGDQVLRYVASVLARVGASPRLAARYGGEEFGVILPGEDLASVTQALDRARSQIGSRLLRRRSTDEELGRVTVSVGVAQLYPGDSVATLVGRADKALYASKRAGRNRVTACADPAPADVGD